MTECVFSQCGKADDWVLPAYIEGQDRTLALNKDALPCCKGEGFYFHGNSIFQCALKQTMMTTQKLTEYMHATMSLPDSFINFNRKNDVKWKKWRLFLKNQFKDAEPQFKDSYLHHSQTHPGYTLTFAHSLLWLAWYQKIRIIPLKFSSQLLDSLLAQLAGNKTKPLIFLAGVEGLWNEAKGLEFDAILSYAYHHDIAIWLELKRDLVNAPTQLEAFDRKTAFFTRVKKAQERANDSWLSEPSKKRLQEISEFIPWSTDVNASTKPQNALIKRDNKAFK